MIFRKLGVVFCVFVTVQESFPMQKHSYSQNNPSVQEGSQFFSIDNCHASDCQSSRIISQKIEESQQNALSQLILQSQFFGESEINVYDDMIPEQHMSDNTDWNSFNQNSTNSKETTLQNSPKIINNFQELISDPSIRIRLSENFIQTIELAQNLINVYDPNKSPASNRKALAASSLEFVRFAKKD